MGSNMVANAKRPGEAYARAANTWNWMYSRAMKKTIGQMKLLRRKPLSFNSPATDERAPVAGTATVCLSRWLVLDISNGPPSTLTASSAYHIRCIIIISMRWFLHLSLPHLSPIFSFIHSLVRSFAGGGYWLNGLNIEYCYLHNGFYGPPLENAMELAEDDAVTASDGRVQC